MPAPALRLSDRQLKAVKAKDKDYVLSDGDGLQPTKRSINEARLVRALLYLGFRKFSIQTIPNENRRPQSPIPIS